MCGRARLSSDVSEIKVAFRIPPERPTPNFAASWNVAPTDPLPVVRYDPKDHQRSLDVMRWGLVPFWAKDQGRLRQHQRQGRGHREKARLPRGFPAAALPGAGRQLL
jgi:putative SOS response-associated peptidase YedK